MSNRGIFGPRRTERFPSVPTGDAVATFSDYESAQRAVDVLAKADFPLAHVTIVGNDVASVERVTGKMSWGRAAVAGAASGAWLGLFFGLLLFLFSPASSPAVGMMLAAILLGAGFGMFFGLVSYGFGRKRRDFTSVMQLAAVTYSVVVDSGSAARARVVLDSAGAADASVTPRESAASAPETRRSSWHDEPPRYGERLPAPPTPEEASPDRPAVGPDDAADADPGDPEHDRDAPPPAT